MRCSLRCSLVALLLAPTLSADSFAFPRVQLWPLPTPTSGATPSPAAAGSDAAPESAPALPSEAGAETSTASLTLNQAATPPTVTLWEALPAPEAPSAPDSGAAQAQAQAQAQEQAQQQAQAQAQAQAQQLRSAANSVLGTSSVGTVTGLAAGIPSLVSGLVKNSLTLIPLNQTYPQAICNDGTTAGYYFQEGLPSSTDWIIYLEGGMWCWSTASCIARCKATPFECSSSTWTRTTSLGGIFAVTKARGVSARVRSLP